MSNNMGELLSQSLTVLPNLISGDHLVPKLVSVCLLYDPNLDIFMTCETKSYGNTHSRPVPWTKPAGSSKWTSVWEMASYFFML